MIALKYLDEGSRLQQERNRLGLTQVALAEKIGSSLAAVKAYERGVSAPNRVFASAMGNLGIDMRFVLLGELPEPSKQASTSASLQATLTRCHHGQSLVVLDSEPFNGLEIRPGELRELAQRLTALADMAAKLSTGGKHWRPTRVQLNGLKQGVA